MKVFQMKKIQKYLNESIPNITKNNKKGKTIIVSIIFNYEFLFLSLFMVRYSFLLIYITLFLTKMSIILTFVLLSFTNILQSDTEHFLRTFFLKFTFV